MSAMIHAKDTRVGSTTNSVTRTFLRDGVYVTDPVLSDGAAFYTPGVSERRGGVTTFLHSGLKNADAQSTASGLTGARQYDAFGNLLSSSGSWQGPFGYAGAFGYQEDTTGLMLLGHRLYDPSTGRFLTRDPIQDGRNWYVYCGNDPLSHVDPTGLIWDKIRDFFRDLFGRPQPVPPEPVVPDGGGSTGKSGSCRFKQEYIRDRAIEAGEAIVSHPLPPFVGAGSSALSGGKALLEAVIPVAGWRARTEYALEEDFEMAGGCYRDAFHKRYGHRF